MRNTRARALLVLMLAVSACRTEAKQAALAEAEVNKVDAACATGDREKALAAMEAAAKANAAFARAYEGAMADVPDKAQVNPCGLVLADIKIRLDKMKQK